MTVYPFLMFDGKAGEAIDLYMKLFPSAELLSVETYGVSGPGPEGSIKKAVFSLAGQTVMCSDSPIRHDFTFTPAFTFFVNCDSEPELIRLSAALSDGGKHLMPLDDYGFSRKFAWVSDRFGVSWQLNLVTQTAE
jgi:predicted 3-demethylubiquinone-9 3-methyltransferase (glyoxalase superfamily)